MGVGLLCASVLLLALWGLMCPGGTGRGIAAMRAEAWWEGENHLGTSVGVSLP
jgi:hypothetical protein